MKRREVVESDWPTDGAWSRSSAVAMSRHSCGECGPCPARCPRVIRAERLVYARREAEAIALLEATP